MKIKCKVCRKETEIDELEYTPGDKIIVECHRCGNELEAVIPLREEQAAEKPSVKVVENDLKSAWYAAASTPKSEPADKPMVKRIEKNITPTTSNTSTNNFVTHVPTKRQPSSTASESSKPISNAQSIDTQERKISFQKIIIIVLVVIVIILGGWLLLGKGESVKTQSEYAEHGNTIEEEIVEEEVNPFYEILDHPERELSWSDIKDFDKIQLRILRNSYFARHGYIFNDPELTNFFSQFAWYHPYTKDVINSFSQIEKNNVELIRRYENQ